MKMAKLGVVIDRWMARQRPGHQRGPVLDVDGRVLRRGAVHGDEHDEQRPALERVRSGCRRAWSACTRCGWRRRRPARCSTGTTTTATIPNKAVCFHCSNLPKHFFEDVRMDYQEIIAGTVGKLNTFGTCVGRVKAGADELTRASRRDDSTGKMRGYVGEGRFTDDPLRDLRRSRRGGDSAAAGPAALHLRERVSSTTSRRT